MIKFYSEKHFEDFLEATIDSLLELDCPQVYRQVKLGNHGICDLIVKSTVFIDKDNEHTKYDLIEIKNEPLNLKHIAQISRYKNYFDSMESPPWVEYSIITTETDYYNDPDFKCLFIQSIEWLSVYCLSVSGNEFYLKECKGYSVPGSKPNAEEFYSATGGDK